MVIGLSLAANCWLFTGFEYRQILPSQYLYLTRMSGVVSLLLCDTFKEKNIKSAKSKARYMEISMYLATSFVIEIKITEITSITDIFDNRL